MIGTERSFLLPNTECLEAAEGASFLLTSADCQQGVVPGVLPSPQFADNLRARGEN